MSYPQQPGEYPAGQPGQYPGQAPPPPQPPFPGGNEMTNPPSKGTTIAAAILAILGALFGVFGAISSFAGTAGAVDTAHIPDSVMWLQAIAFVLEVFTLGGGATALFMRKNIGRWLVVAGSAIHIIQSVVGTIMLANSVSDKMETPAVAIGGGVAGMIIALLPAIATLILALLPPTGRWLNWTAPQQQRFQG